MTNVQHKLIDELNRTIIAFENNDCAELLKQIGDARFVLLGEATHGTREFYEIRAEISKQLILHKQFNAIAIEADWPNAYQIHRYINGAGDDQDWLRVLAV